MLCTSVTYIQYISKQPNDIIAIMWKDQEAQKAHAKKIALKGGLTTKKRGKKYYSEIGKKGAAAKTLKRA
jgi:hypothetical protein